MMSLLRRSTGILMAGTLMTSVLLACGPEGGDPSEDELVAPGLTVEAAPTINIGVLGGDPMQEFDRVVTPFLMPNGNLAVPTQGANSIRVFGPDGSFLTELGGPGDGPGEFNSLQSAWNRGDTIEAWDSRARRISRFLPDGEVEVVNLNGVTESLDGGVGPLGQGWALVSRYFGEPRDRVGVHSVSREGEHLVQIAALEGMARYRIPGMSGPHPLTPTVLLRTHQGELYAAEAMTPVISVFDLTGVLLREIPLDLEEFGPPNEVFEQVIDSAVARVEEDRKAQTRQRLSAFPRLDHLPVFWSFILDSDGLVWVRPYDPFQHSLELGGRLVGRAGPGGEWLVVSQEGKEVARVRMPPGLEPMQITQDAVVGVHQDELGVESVRVHSLRRN